MHITGKMTMRAGRGSNKQAYNNTRNSKTVNQINTTIQKLSKAT